MPWELQSGDSKLTDVTPDAGGAALAAMAQARDAAEAANLAKTRFLIGLSHEIRSPLNAIHGYAQLLERGAAISPSDAGRIIRRSSEHLSNLIDGLLDISRIEGGVLKLSQDIVPLHLFLDQLAAMFSLQAAEKGLAFHYRPAANLPAHVRADEKRLRQVLINLLSNAIKYTPGGEVSMTVRYRGLVAEFEIADTGIGIAPDDLARIFEPFDRGSAKAAKTAPGTGLGLALSRMLAHVMGGEIMVTSTPGTGSRFSLKLMLSEPAQLPAETSRADIVSYDGPRRTLLAIDDDPAQLAVLQGLLRPLGFSVFAAGSGSAGLNLAQHCRPDLVLLDVEMPGLSGWEVARQLRADFGDALGILMVSGNAHEFIGSELDDRHGARMPHDGFVLKPVDQNALLEALARHLDLSWNRVAIGDAPVVGPRPVDPGLPVAAAAHRDTLSRLVRTGNIKALAAALDSLDTEIPGAAALTGRLRAALDDFDLARFAKLLDQPPGGPA
ncbi:ATP-binding protein [Sandarakinorhabdus sp.]|uniref:ATP-binding response regulator n=1 Tax=Sandarakinorhabdus sp. TaxID=1916663 RepID=UPI00286EAA9C|nr:ATP-binding protein [Sandarakinorhabdus sp.]